MQQTPTNTTPDLPHQAPPQVQPAPPSGDDGGGQPGPNFSVLDFALDLLARGLATGFIRPDGMKAD